MQTRIAHICLADPARDLLAFIFETDTSRSQTTVRPGRWRMLIVPHLICKSPSGRTPLRWLMAILKPNGRFAFMVLAATEHALAGRRHKASFESLSGRKAINRDQPSRTSKSVKDVCLCCDDWHASLAKPLHISGDTLNTKPEQSIQRRHLLSIFQRHF